MQASLPQHRRPRILIADDEAANITMLSMLFQADCDIDVVTNGAQALQHIMVRDYDVALLDIVMPEMTGLAVLEKVRQTKNLLELPIILISAVQDSSEIVHGIKLGANDYITKPLNVDIVEARVRMQIALRTLSDERGRAIEGLQSANALKLRMMRIASHDLRNPLNNLRMLTTLFRKRTDSQDVHHMLNMVDESLNTMLAVVTDLMDATRADTDDVEITLEAVDSAEIVQQLVSEYGIAATHKGITLHTNVNGIIRADETRITQAIANLISNAIKYSPHGSTITIESRLMDGNSWRLSVTDEGPGIPVGERAYLFQPFSEISTKPTGGEPSTGLGLWIVSEMMRLQDGRVGVDHLETGSRFWIEAPCHTHEDESS